MMRGAWRSAGACLAVVVLLAGCGSSSKSSSSTSSSTTTNEAAAFKASYAAVANQLKQGSQAIGAAIQQAPKQTDAQLAAAFNTLATRWQNALSQLQTLKPPASLAVTFNTVTGAAGRVEADLNAIIAAARTHSAAAAKQASASLVNDILTAKAASQKISNG